METKDIPEAAVSSWEPMQKSSDLAAIGKLGEECGELSTIISRCIIQGIDGLDPDTGKPNREALQDEIADVIALGYLNIRHFGLDIISLSVRVDKKQKMKQAWVDKLKQKESTK